MFVRFIKTGDNHTQTQTVRFNDEVGVLSLISFLITFINV